MIFFYSASKVKALAMRAPKRLERLSCFIGLGRPRVFTQPGPLADMTCLPPDLWPGAIACDEATDILAASRRRERRASARLHQWFHAAEGVSLPPAGADGLE
jgi:hypothetical protein